MARPPIATVKTPRFVLLASIAVYFAIYKAHMTDSIDLRNAIYLLATLPFGVVLAANVFRAHGTPAGRTRQEVQPATAGG